MPRPTETKVPHTSEMEKVPHPSKVEASTTIEVTSKIATKTLATYDMEVTPPIETNVTTPN